MRHNREYFLDCPSHINTAAVVVLFHPEGDLVDRIQRVLSQVSWLTIVSNDGVGVKRLECLDTHRITHFQANGNIGLAAALNVGLEVASKKIFTWCLLLDQDTLVDMDLVEGLAKTFLACPSRDSIGVLAPNYRSPAGNRFAYPIDPEWQVLDTAITSGSLIALSTVQRAGGMKESFFIEGIDIEFSLRVRSVGLQVIASGRTLMTHGAGAAEERTLFGRTVLVGHHSAWRCYMQFRNLTWTLWSYRRQEPRWVRLTIVSVLKRVCLVLLFEKHRLRKIWAIFYGSIFGLLQVAFPDWERRFQVRSATLTNRKRL